MEYMVEGSSFQELLFLVVGKTLKKRGQTEWRNKKILHHR